MAVSKSTNTYNRLNWEESDFPILCQTCLGDNPYLRMMKDKFGAECKICERPFTVFRWCPGARMRFKKTEVCQSCAKVKNLCQTCLLDLEYGLPVQVRDQALAIKDDIPRSDVNKEYYLQNMDRELANNEPGSAPGQLGKAQSPNDLLLKLARTTPYYKRNRPHICSFWVKGECKRGEECPYRHEKPTDPDDPLSDQNMRDRYYGVNDPVANKLMSRANAMPKLDVPEDRTVTTLYIGGLNETITEKNLRDQFYQFGEIRSVSMVSKQQCAFITFTTRVAAECAAEKTFNKLIVKGRRLHIKWGKSAGQAGTSGVVGGRPQVGELMYQQPVTQGVPSSLPPPPIEGIGLPSGAPNYFNLAQPLVMPMPPPPTASTGNPLPPPPGTTMVQPMHFQPMYPPGAVQLQQMPGPSMVRYPSQDPQRMGSTGSKPGPSTSEQQTSSQ